MKLVETLKTKVLQLLKTWQVREKLCLLWTKIKNTYAHIAQKLRPYQRFKNTRAYAKLMAMTERISKTSRDIYDVWFFLEHHFPINKEIVEKRANVSFPGGEA